MIDTLDLFNAKAIYTFPQTRYQGSKLKHSEWIFDCLKCYNFNSVLDGFGGTGALSHKLKKEGKKIVYNDILKFNHIIGKALIENSDVKYPIEMTDEIFNEKKDFNYKHTIFENFKDIYFTDDENYILDILVQNITQISNEYKKSIAFFALFQACIIKRPYNLFHRKNLYTRFRNVKRGFGNKTTWDRPFDFYIRKFINECNNAIFNNGKNNISINEDIKDIKCIGDAFDLVYLDPPYLSKNGSSINYLKFYHFLEGIANYEDWEININHNTKHKQLFAEKTPWESKDTVYNELEFIIEKFSSSIIAISYRSNGIPNISEIKKLLEKYGKKVAIYESKPIKYALSKEISSEVLVVGK